MAFVGQVSADGLWLDQVERGLLTQLLQLGQALLQGFVAAAGAGDVEAATPPPDGRTTRSLPEPHTRIDRSVFGYLPITLFVYGTREGQPIEAVPLDARLSLPAGQFSSVLEDGAQRLCVKQSFAEAAKSLHDLLGSRPSVRSLEHINRAMADFAATVGDQQPVPPAGGSGRTDRAAPRWQTRPSRVHVC